MTFQALDSLRRVQRVIDRRRAFDKGFGEGARAGALGGATFWATVAMLLERGFTLWSFAPAVVGVSFLAVNHFCLVVDVRATTCAGE